MNTQHTLSRLGRIARRTTIAAIAGALAVALVPTQALAADDAVTITSPIQDEVVVMYADPTTPAVTEDPVVVTFVAEGSPATCALDDQAPFPCTSPVSFEHVPYGLHHVTVIAGAASQTTTFAVSTFALGLPPEFTVDDNGMMRPPGVTARWKVGAHRTWVRLLKLRHMSRHVRVHVRCKGAGCPTPHRFTRRASGHLDLTPYFRGHGLRPGARIVIRISTCGATLWTFRYTIRSGARPRLVEN